MQRLRPVQSPTDYYAGVRRSPDALPDNVLIFVRRSAKSLRPTTIISDFHQRWVLIIGLQGRGTVLSDRMPNQIVSGRAVLIPPLHLHAYADVTETINWMFVTFEWPSHTAQAEDWNGVRVLDSACVAHLWAIVSEWNSKRRDGLRIAAELQGLLHRLFPRRRVSSKEPLDGIILAVQRAVKAIPLGASTTAIARCVGLSESHARARFRKAAGISLGRYLREARIRQAAVWLREEGIAVKEAAERAGFNDIYTFSRAFRRALGMPPSALKR